jgi:hypothetical protein
MGGIVQFGDVPTWVAAGISALSIWTGLRAQQRAQAVDWAAMLKDLSGYSDEELQRIVEDNPVIAEMTALAWEAAATAASDEKRRLLAKVVAAAMSGTADAEVEPLGFLLRTVIALEPAHMTLLVVIASPREGQGQLAGRMIEGHVSREEITTRWSSSEDLLDPTLSVLLREGLIRENNAPWNDETRSLSATGYGQRFLRFLNAPIPAIQGGADQRP